MAGPFAMALEHLEILTQSIYEGGRAFGAAGAYVRIDALAHYRVDPAHPANRAIVDLERAVSGPDGTIGFSGDVTLLRPADPSKANGALLVEVPNRGNRIALRAFNMAPGDFTSTADIDPGDGFLLERGWCIAWCGWQWDVPRSKERMGLEPPWVDPADLGEPAQMQLRIQPDMRCRSLRLTDDHVGTIGNHRLVETGDCIDPAARLLVRDRLDSPPQELPRSSWRFARDEGGEAVTDPGHVWLDGGFEAGRIYDVLYTPAQCPVVGAGLLAVRDFGAYLARGEQSPIAGMARHRIVEGQSQTGRFLRTFLGLGLNLDEEDKPVYDGALVHIAGGRRGEFNQRYGQPSVQPAPSFGHLFPFGDDPQTDPRTGRTAGLLDRQREAGGVPKIIYTDTSSEYHRGDASLAHLSLADEVDLEPPQNVRRYLFSSTQHGPGALPFARFSIFGTRAANHFNVIDYRPLYRAALQNLLEWVAGECEPPPSRFPRMDNGTAVTRAEALAACAAIPGLEMPSVECLPSVYPLDLGPAQGAGVGRFPAHITGRAYPDRVSAVDGDGNEVAGVRMPDITVPVATHTGFNSRDPRTGGAGHYLEYLGSTLPFPRDELERQATGDPRLPIAARYRDLDDYLEKIRTAARALVAERYLLEEDIAVCVHLAQERYLACTAPD